jgi:hypothetical protein
VKAITQTKKPVRRHRPVATRLSPVSPAPLSDEEFRRQLHVELSDEIAAARDDTRKRFGHLLRPRTPAESKANAAAARALFAQWAKEDLKDPPPHDDWEKFKALLEANRMRSAPIFA